MAGGKINPARLKIIKGAARRQSRFQNFLKDPPIIVSLRKVCFTCATADQPLISA
jgi:hypothetical protein